MVFAAVAVGIVLLIGFFLIRSVVRQHLLLKRRPEELRRAGGSLGLRLVAREAEEEEHERDRRLLQGTTLAAAVEEMEAGLGDALYGEIEGVEVRLADYSKSVAGGRLANEMHTVLLLTPRRGKLPRFYLQPEVLATKPAEIAGCSEPDQLVPAALPPGIRGLSLHVHQQDRQWVEGALGDNAVAEFLKRDQGLWVLEGLGDRLLVHRLNRVASEQEIAEVVRGGVWLAGRLLAESPYRG